MGYAQRLGLQVTAQELKLWHIRSHIGPYKSLGDVSKNSPGDWKRIEREKNHFMASPEISLWDGLPGTGCIQQTPENPGFSSPKYVEMRYWTSAAFFGMVRKDKEVLEVVKKYLLIQIKNPNLQPSDQKRWCNHILADGHPSFNIANWVTQLLYIYEFTEIGGANFSKSEKILIDQWFIDWASFFHKDVEYYLGKLFKNRHNYRDVRELHLITPEGKGEEAYYNGPFTRQIQRVYNNRKAAQVRIYGLVGVKYGIKPFIISYKQFAKEFLAFACYPNGAFAEFHRGKPSFPDLGMGYTASTLSAILTVADALARTGDTEIYEYETSHGMFGTEGSVKKSYLWAMVNYCKLVTGSNEFFMNSSPSSRIDGKNESNNWYSVHEVMFVMANAYYKNDFIKKVIDRTWPGVDPYPVRTAGFGAFLVWNGEGGAFPGVLFMFNHDLELF